MMMLRLARAGTKKRPVYHLVAADRRARRDGKFVENLGYFIPARDVVVVQSERIEYWLSQGAQPTVTAANLIKKVRKLGNVEPAAKQAYVPPPVKPVEPKKDPSTKAEGDAPANAEAKPADAESQAAETPAGDETKSE